jgi:hypothetical protein
MITPQLTGRELTFTGSYKKDMLSLIQLFHR